MNQSGKCEGPGGGDRWGALCTGFTLVLINYSTNMCQNGQGPMIQITSLKKVIVGIIGGGKRGWDPCVCVAFPL